MKKLVFLFSMILLTQLTFSQNCNCGTGDKPCITGDTFFYLNPSGEGGKSYRLCNYPSGARLEWSITGSNRCYIYPNGDYASINVYGAGSYRIVCDIYVNNVRVEAGYIYVTVYPYGGYGNVKIETDDIENLLLESTKTASNDEE